MNLKYQKIGKTIFLLAIGIALFIRAVMQPFNAAPDEHMRYSICQYLYQYHSLPHGGDPVIRDAVWGYSYAFFPILTHMVSALFMTVVSWFTTEAFALLMAARMVSVLCGVAMAWFVLAIGERLFGRTPWKWVFVILSMLLPQCMYLFSYVNNDCLALLSTSMLIHAWLLGHDHDWDLASCSLLTLGIILCALSYYNAYGVILASMVLMLGELFLRRKDPVRWKRLFVKLLVVSVVVLIGISWWFIRNYHIYDGDFLGLTTSEIYSQQYAIESIKPSNRQTPQLLGESLGEMLISRGWLKVTALSFVGCFGYMSIPLKLWMYLIYGVIVLIGLLAAGYTAAKRMIIGKSGQDQGETADILPLTNRSYAVLWGSAMFLTAVIPNILNLIHSYYVDYEPQGRYSMAMLIPLMCLVTLGWKQIQGFKKYLPWILILVWILLGFRSFLILQSATCNT